MSSIDRRQSLMFAFLVVPLLVVSAVPWNRERAVVLATGDSDVSRRVDSCCASRLTVVERYCWKVTEEIEAGAECRFTLLNAGREPIRLKAGLQNHLSVTHVPSEIAPGGIAFVTANCQSRGTQRANPWIGRMDVFTSDPDAAIVSLYALEGNPNSQGR